MVEYFVVSHSSDRGVYDASIFSSLVTEKLMAGFELHGSMSVVYDPEHSKMIFFQALMKKD